MQSQRWSNRNLRVFGASCSGPAQPSWRWMHNPKATISRWLTVAILAGWLVLLVPMDARAHFGPEGVNGAQLDLGKDGETSPVGATKTVTGRKFVPNDVVRIFQCPYDATDLLLQCEPLGTAQTDAEGGFTATNVPVPSVLTTPSGPVQCQGFMGSTPCAVAAATYDSLQQPTSMAKHFICFQGPSANGCVAPDGGGTTTTTSSTTTSSTTTSTTSTTLPRPTRAPCTLRETAIGYSAGVTDFQPDVGSDTEAAFGSGSRRALLAAPPPARGPPWPTTR